MSRDLVVEYVGIELGRVQQVMYRPERGSARAETRLLVHDLDGRPYVAVYDRRYYLDSTEIEAAREARRVPYRPIVVDGR